MQQVRKAPIRTNDFLPIPGWPEDELSPPDGLTPVLAHHLWQRARDVKLWSAIEPAKRRGLFRRTDPPTTAYPESFADALKCLDALIETPHSVPADKIATACAQISRWAETEGHLPLARSYAEAWATVEPLNAQAAATAGGYCTRLADDSRAELWLQRAVRLARRSRDWEWYIRAFLRLGILRFNLGNYKPARRYYFRAYRKAVWAGYSGLAGKARHDLMTICTDVGAFNLGIDYALEVLVRYPANDPVFPYFVHDFAFLLAQAGHYEHAAPLLQAALHHIPEHRRLLIHGTMACTAAALGDRQRFETLAAQVIKRARSSEEGAAAAFVRLADGARQFSQWERAERFAGRALEIAYRRHEGQPQRLAYQVMDRVAVRDSSITTVPLQHPIPTLLPSFLARLQKHHPPEGLAGALTKMP